MVFFIPANLNKKNKAARVVRQSGLWTQGVNLGPESVVINKDVLPCRKEEINFAVCGAPLSQGKASQKLGETGTSV